MNIRKPIIRVIAFSVCAPIALGHYIITAGDPITPQWMEDLDQFFNKLSGDPKWDYYTNKSK